MIRVLSDETINQISAGEVIERPFSVVKELLENSIDAGSSSVTVEIRDGGISLIRVTDNGSGIAHDEVRTAFLRHATSKIRDASDLFRLSTLGFRGEALASIASAADVELISKCPGDLMATHYRIENGQELDFSEIGAPEGTTFLVRDLFKNIPVRRKFLKSPKAESAKIQDILEKEALSHPEVSFRFVEDKKIKLLTLGNGSLKDVIYSIYGREITRELLDVNQSFLPSHLTGVPSVSVRGFIGRPAVNRGSRSFETCFVNSRFIRNPILTKAIEDAYRPFVMMHKFPFTVLKLDLDPELVDVNVHPQKSEVRFSDGQKIYTCVMKALDRTLHSAELIEDSSLPDALSQAAFQVTDLSVHPSSGVSIDTSARKDSGICPDLSSSQDSHFPEKHGPDDTADAETRPVGNAEAEKEISEGFESERSYLDAISRAEPYEKGKRAEIERMFPHDSGFHLSDFLSDQVPASSADRRGISGSQESLFNGRFLSEKAKTQHRIIGQVFDTYWLVEYGKKLYIIDQHAAHEKVNFERMMKRLKEKNPASQLLNPPILLTLTPEEALMLDQYRDYFTGLGYEFTPMGGRDYSVSAVPADLPELDKADLFLEILDGLSGDTTLTTPETIYYEIASKSCKAAVKGGNHLSLTEADHLITELLSLENPYQCPHGRPTIIAITEYELEKKFKRIV